MRKLFLSVLILWGVVLFFPITTEAQDFYGSPNYHYNQGMMSPIESLGMGGSQQMLGQQPMMDPRVVQMIQLQRASFINQNFHMPGSQAIGPMSNPALVPPVGFSVIQNNRNYNWFSDNAM